MSAIAIVGMGCRFAGAPDLPSYWQLLLEGGNAFCPVPADRWSVEAFEGRSARDQDRSTAPMGAFMEDIQSFPALALGIPPRRVEVMDPQQRFTLETALEAIEDAGYTREQLADRTGVFVGITGHEYRVLQAGRVLAIMMASGQLGDAPEDPTALAEAVNRVVPPRAFSAPGVLGNMCASIVAQELDLNGPAYTLDAACASALVAVSNAVSQLRSGAIDVALAGGAYLQISPEHFIAFSRIGAMSLAGACRPFDAAADGFVQGDGVGMIMLKRLEDAERDGDRIYSVLHGVAINNDGRGDGPMAPVKEGQVDVIRTAWSDAGIEPSRASHIEAHGTGTSVGDACEAAGLHEVFADAERVWLGSSKANVGHTMSAAGIAGIIKTALAIHHRTIPPLGGFELPREDLGLEDGVLAVPRSPTLWENDERIAGVSSFGFGGTNGHVVLGSHTGTAPVTPRAQQEIVLLSAGDEARLTTLATRTAAAIRTDPSITVASVAQTWSTRTPRAVRASIVAHNRQTLLAGLDAIASGAELPRGTHVGTPEGTPSIAFLYPGQGAQRIGMLSDVVKRFPTVADALALQDVAMEGVLDRSLGELVYPAQRTMPITDDAAAAELTQTQYCQPVMHAAGVALTALLTKVGVRPTVVTGHSLGEFTAAAVAGVFDHGDGARLVARRGRAMASVDGDGGAMAAIMADLSTVQGLLADGAVVANINHPQQTVISGTTEGVAATVAAAEAAEIKAKPLDVSHAFHSPLFDGFDGGALVDGLTMADPTVPLASAISGSLVTEATEARTIFARHATSPVRFTEALAACAEAGADLYLQVGAGGPLASFARGTLEPGHRGVITLASREDVDGGFSLLDSLGFLWISGVDLDVSSLVGPAERAVLPPSALARQSYWSVKNKRTRTLRLEGARTVTPKPEPVVEAPAAPEAVSGSDDDILEGVMGVVAKVSAYPRHAIKSSMKLIDDLGFDSLMVGDLATRLAEAFPEIGAVPQELLVDSPTVGVLVDFVRSGGIGPQTIDDDAPLSAWRWSWSPVALPALPVGTVRGPVVVSGPDRTTAAAIATALDAAGVTAMATDTIPEDAGTVVWCAGQEAASRLSWPDRAGRFLAAMAPLAHQPDVVAISRTDDVWAAGLAGAVRALSREWTDARIKHLQADEPTELAQVLTAELCSADRTVDVRYVDGARHLPSLRPDASPAHPAPGAGDTVLVTGGTRGIGLALGTRLAALGADVLLLGRNAPAAADQAVIDAFPSATVCLADVTDAAALAKALDGRRVTHLVHAAGTLADGPVESIDPAVGTTARAIKVGGWINALEAAGDSLKVAVGIGSWAGAFGNRHQTHYAAANALLAALAERARPGVRAVVGAYGPWTDSAMVASIPAPVVAAMRAEGVDFVGKDAGLDALMADLSRNGGSVVIGRRVPSTTRIVECTVSISTSTDPYLLDHAIEGTPVLPFAAAADLMSWTADRPAALTDITLYRGVTVAEPVALTTRAQGDRVELRIDGALCYGATLCTDAVTAPAPAEGGEAPTVSLDTFYSDVAFHGPLLRGLERADAIGNGFIRGAVRAGLPTGWSPTSTRASWSIDPLALDSLMQLAGIAAWQRFQRFGTPMRMGRLHQPAPLEPGRVYTAEAHFDEDSPERLSATLVLRDDTGAAVLVAEDMVAELREKNAPEAPAWTPRAEDTDLNQWQEVADLQIRLQGVDALGLQNPYFHVHEGTARDTTTVSGRELVNFSSYNYIGLSGNDEVIADVHAAVETYGTSVSASRVASGERPFHGELERMLAKAQRTEAALLFTAGHATNVTTIGHLMGPEDLILHDEYIHDSAMQGIKLSGAARRNFRHEDPAHLEEQLKSLRPHYRRCLIIVEGVYSMDGDICQLPAYIEIKKRHGCLLMVDEAHSFGVVGATGSGVAEHFDIDGREVDIWMGTLSKSLASCGGWICGSETLITYLKYTAPGFVYSAGLTPANGVAALAALSKMLDEPERVHKLQDNAVFFHAELVKRNMDTGPALGGSAVIPVITGNSMHALVLSERLLTKGINVQPIVYPAVADDASRLRFFLSSTHSHEQLAFTAQTVADTLAEVRADFPLP